MFLSAKLLQTADNAKKISQFFIFAPQRSGGWGGNHLAGCGTTMRNCGSGVVASRPAAGNAYG